MGEAASEMAQCQQEANWAAGAVLEIICFQLSDSVRFDIEILLLLVAVN